MATFASARHFSWAKRRYARRISGSHRTLRRFHQLAKQKWIVLFADVSQPLLAPTAGIL